MRHHRLLVSVGLGKKVNVFDEPYMKLYITFVKDVSFRRLGK